MIDYKQEYIDGHLIYKLIHKSKEGKSIEVWINTSHGMNMCQLLVDGHKIIAWDKERCINRQSYGTPVLYPAPNRVASNRFRFQEVEYPMVMHGILRFQSCDHIQVDKTVDTVSVTGYFVFEKGNEKYNLFPFESTLAVTYRLSSNQVTMNYRLENRDDKDLPYGFALHPFFNKHGKTGIQVFANDVMEMDDEKLPTGCICPVNKTLYDLNQLVDTNELNLDHVYTGMTKELDAKIIYHELPFDIHLVSSGVFSHVVIYIPKDQPFFCIENQTCATNAHNLYAQGYEKLSGLEVVKAGEVAIGEVSYMIQSKK